MDTIKKDQTFIRKFFITVYVIALISLLVYSMTHYHSLFLITFVCFLFLPILFYRQEKIKQKQLENLIQNADAIIDQKPLNVIDGEGNISLLSHKLYILNKRYYSLIHQFKEEQIKLKDYIEDISHQLKTPITSMRLNEELLLETMDYSRQRDKVEQIYQQTLKMNQLVNDLLTLALLDSQSIEFKYNYYSIEIIIEDIEEDLEYLIQEKQMNIHLHHHQEQIFCDKKWIEEALKNIIKNCIEKNNQSIIDIYVEETDSLIEIKIRDYGEGFLQEDLPHLFERFYRGKNKDYQGVGIGLSLSKEIIEMHHGFMKAYNHQGACFEITIPKVLAKKKL